jgi:hypothetical protein
MHKSLITNVSHKKIEISPHSTSLVYSKINLSDIYIEIQT